MRTPVSGYRNASGEEILAHGGFSCLAADGLLNSARSPRGLSDRGTARAEMHLAKPVL
jgi:hypothetical protein